MTVAPAVTPKLVGRYALFEEIACGGMAAVHVGRLVGPVGFSRTVAIKRLHPQFAKDPEFVTMFLDEARLAARVRHPNVVPTLDVVASQGELFLVMEYVQGESFARLLYLTKTAGKRAPREMVCAIVASVLHGLHAAHEAKSERGDPLGIVHRDVSPQNILVGVDGIARVLDFGIAKAAGRAQVTREGQVRGKMAYIAPEQLQNSAADRKADIYAAAVVLWEALTGERLFLGESESATIAKVLAGEVSPPSKLVSDISPALDAVVMRGLNRDRTARFETARDMARALEACGSFATPSEVGEWVEATADTALANRARIVSEVEQIEDFSVADGGGRPPRVFAASEEPTAVDVGLSPGDQRSGAGAGPDAEPARRRRVVILAAVVGFLLGAIGLWIAFPSRHEPQPIPPAPAAAAPLPAPAPIPSASVSVEIPAPPTASVSSPPAPGPTASAAPSVETTARKHFPPPPPRPMPKAAEKRNCEPPYTIDQDGHRHYKMECL
ncbi:MAG TPA: serine/threonine-protein kinase [Polyangiaceae bacterium]|nr:serine/threonine-protein kinase [Polyangiaceae bacterium]